MDDDLEAVLFMIGLFAFAILVPFGIVISCAACAAWGRTKQWRKEKARLNDPDQLAVERDRLVAAEDEDELDPEDSDDEVEIKAKEEEERDWQLTTRQKFRKEFVKMWKGKSMQERKKADERAERKKLAQAVAKELSRIERRNQRKANAGAASSSEGDGLPTYNNAVADDLKR
jgi:hypothetical protein